MLLWFIGVFYGVFELYTFGLLKVNQNNFPSIIKSFQSKNIQVDPGPDQDPLSNPSFEMV